MSVDALLTELSAHGAYLALSDSGLVVRGPIDGLRPALVHELRERRAELKARLEAEQSGQAIDSYPASFGQARLAFLNTVHGASAAYNVAASLILRGAVDLDQFLSAVALVMQQHPALATCCEMREGRVWARVTSILPTLPSVIDLTGWSAEDACGKVQEVRRAIASTCFDLKAAPLWRCAIIRRGKHELEFVLAIHHFIADGWSLARSLGTLAKTYSSLCRGKVIKPSKPSTSYSHFAEWERRMLQSPRGRADLAWWSGKAAAEFGTAANIPTDRARPSAQSDRGDRVALSLEPQLAWRLRTFAAERRITLSAVISAAYATALYRMGGSERFSIGLAVSNRPEERFSDVFGFFVNWLPVVADFSGDRSFEDFLKVWLQSRESSLEHQYTPFDAIAAQLPGRGGLSHHPVFQHMVVSHVPARRIRFGEVTASIEPLPTGTSKLDLTLFLTDAGRAVPIEGQGDVFLEFEYSTDLFDRPTIEAFSQTFVTLIDSALARPNVPLSSLRILAPSAASRLEAVAYGGPPSMFASPIPLIAKTAVEHADVPAIIFDDTVVQYGELWLRATEILGALRQRGVQEGDRVALLVSRTPDVVAAYLAVLLCKAIVVALDSSLPDDRRQQILLDSDPRVIVTWSESAEKAGELTQNRSVLRLREMVLRPDEQTVPKFEGSEPAYLMYTSGSTGRPKGVVCSHGALGNFVCWLNDYLGCGPRDRVLCKTPLGFDASLRELLAPLCVGGSLVLAADDVHNNPAALAALIQRKRITIVHGTPTIYREMLAATIEGPRSQGNSLRHVMCGGEPLDAALVANHFEIFPAVRLHNVYGPTECTIDVAFHEVKPGESNVPIGRPIAGAVLCVVGTDLSPLPPAAVGEIVVSGAPLAVGYWRRPEEEESRFVIPATGFLAGRRVYRTGDLGHYSPAGVFFYHGRNDRQVKVRGARVELGEIESALLEQSGVVAAVVVQRKLEGDESHLAAFVQFDSSVEKPNERIEMIRAGVARTLPGYMQPTVIAFVDNFPLLPSGKKNLSALMEMELPVLESALAKPLTEMEALIAGLMSELLRREVQTGDSDFFRLGGHSLSAVRLIGRIAKRCGVIISVQEMFEHRTLTELSSLVERKSAALTQSSRQEIPRAIRPRGAHV